MQESRSQWLADLSREDVWAEEIGHLPSMLYHGYMQLRHLAESGRVYGVMLQCKDFYESLYRIPAIMALAFMESIPGNKDRQEYAEVIRASLESPMSMGQWHQLANVIIRRGKALQLPDVLVKVLKETRALYEMEVSEDFPDVVNWRNSAIGHGALRLEDDPACQAEIRSLLVHLKTYFGTGTGGGAAALYRDVCFRTPGGPLQGAARGDSSDSDVTLSVGGMTCPVTNFIDVSSLKLYLFSSYYCKKRLIKYTSFTDGRDELLPDAYFSQLYEKYVIMGGQDFSLNAGLITLEQEQALEYLRTPSEYVRPTRLIGRLRDLLDEQSKGVIAVFMERGTGKTAFANQMSGLFHRQGLIKNAFSRCYHVQSAALRGINDFVNALNYNFRHSYDQAQNLWGGADDLPALTPEEQDPAGALAAFLNGYHARYGKEYTILVLDGIDELTGETEGILDYVPSGGELAEGVFVLLLSRFRDEPTVLGSSVRYIERAEQLAGAAIRIRRDSVENTEPLTECVEKWKREDPRREAVGTEELLAKADRRFLFLRAYLSMPWGVLLDSTDEYRFIRSCLDHILSLYGPVQQRRL